MFEKTVKNEQKGWSVIALGVIMSISSLALVTSVSSILPVEVEYLRIAMVAGSVVCGIFGVMIISDSKGVK